jgi:hypothetical protein
MCAKALHLTRASGNTQVAITDDRLQLLRMEISFGKAFGED